MDSLLPRIPQGAAEHPVAKHGRRLGLEADAVKYH